MLLLMMRLMTMLLVLGSAHNRYRSSQQVARRMVVTVIGVLVALLLNCSCRLVVYQVLVGGDR